MTPAEFKKKWSRYSGKETSAYQGHLDDLRRLLEQPTPAEADPSGCVFFCFQKRVVKDAELFELHETGFATSTATCSRTRPSLSSPQKRRASWPMPRKLTGS